MKISIGDKFRWVLSSDPYFTKGNIYEVILVNDNLVYLRSNVGQYAFYNFHMNSEAGYWNKVENKKVVKRNLPQWF